MPRKKKQTDELKKQLQKPDRKVLGPKDFLHTGSTLINLACTGNANRGFAKGTYILFAGDSSSGKTWLALSCFAEASINPEFDNYRFIYDNAENGALMDLDFFFGPKVAERLEAPKYDAEGESVNSEMTEDVFYNLENAINEGKPFIYVLDSIDALSDIASEKKFQEQKKASEEGKEVKGDYGMSKPKVASKNLGKVVGKLAKTDSILIALNQTRDNISPTPFAPPKTRSGGWAWEFYAHMILWGSGVKNITKNINGKERQLGVKTRIGTKKNRTTGRVRLVEVPILHSIGIDNVGSLVDYLIDEKIWEKNKQGFITATGLGPTFKSRRRELIKKIESEELEEALVDMVQDTWDEIEDACKVERKSRYR